MFTFKIKEQNIDTQNGNYSFQPKVLYHGRRPINKVVARENLELLSSILEENSIFFGLINGTLLGAARNGEFISYDEDIDLFMFQNRRKDIIDLLHELREFSFEVVRCKGDLLTLMRKKSCIDISFFKEDGLTYSSDACKIPVYFLNEFEEVLLYNKKYNIPSNSQELLKLMYGADWILPQADKFNTLSSGYILFKRTVSKKLPGKLNFIITKLLMIVRQ